ncbi:vegetative cell wall protein gp1-like isoform X3 [Panthera tigris]|uniref:vegetative cell wall protein gp1-like isoform X3 n=1 Tax=Panthera tigris TaxID=9694 RepID=UPI001C6FBE5C|nr:vegetative cell wall protein gp1-like isoform X3 [Panthera tigris]XP_042831606.1 vegetative cell wall protein gp1-like isoform X3 [Panthera tigris]
MRGTARRTEGTTEEAKTAGRRGKAEGSVGGGGTYCGADFPGGEKIRGASVRAEPEVTPANLRPSRAPGAQPHPTPAGKPSPLGTAAPPGAEPCLPGCPAPDSTPAHSSDAVAPPLNSFTGSNCPQTFFVTSNKNVSSPPIAEAPGDGDTRIKSTVYPRACGSPQTRGLVTPYTRGTVSCLGALVPAPNVCPPPQGPSPRSQKLLLICPQPAPAFQQSVCPTPSRLCPPSGQMLCSSTNTPTQPPREGVYP